MHRSAPARTFPGVLLITGLGAAALMLSVGRQVFAAAPFPRKPIKLVVYTGPGGLLDMTARKFADVAKKYTDATFVIENKPGAGGIVAIERVLQMPADGYTLCACTKSNIAKVVSVDSLYYLDALHWVGLLIKDPECVITRRGGPLDSWEALLADARQRSGNQKWLGPAMGGQDHVFAKKTWERFGISADWVPFSSGGEALVALLGDQGTAYVGNPQDTVGKPDLQMIAVSSARRLPQFLGHTGVCRAGSTGPGQRIHVAWICPQAGLPGSRVALVRRTVSQDHCGRTMAILLGKGRNGGRL